MPLVSVVIPSFNHDRFISECIQSILEQTFQDWELIITDDGSTDNSPEIIRSFKDPRIKTFFFPENRGVHAAMGVCLREATGNYVALLNSDDFFSPTKLEKQIDAFRNNLEIAAVFTQVRRVDENGKSLWQDKIKPNMFHEKNRTRWEWLRRFFYEGNCLCHPSVLIRRELYIQLGLRTLLYHQLPDLFMWILLCQTNNIYLIDEPLLNFRVLSNKANRSAGSVEVSERIEFEMRHILSEYENEACLLHLCDIFPELGRYRDQINRDTAPFFLGMIAVSSRKASVRCYGLDLLFRYLTNNPQFTFVENKKEVLGRNYLYQATGTSKIFADYGLLARLKRKLIY